MDEYIIHCTAAVTISKFKHEICVKPQSLNRCDGQLFSRLVKGF